MLVVDNVQVRFVGVMTLRVTVPVNPFTGWMLIVEVPATPVLTATLVGLADIVKSCTPVTT